MTAQTKLGLLGVLFVVLGLFVTWSWYFTAGPGESSAVTLGPRAGGGVKADPLSSTDLALPDAEEPAGETRESREAVLTSEAGRLFLRGRLLRETGAPFAHQTFAMQLFSSLELALLDAEGRPRYTDYPSSKLSGVATDELGYFQHDLTDYLTEQDPDGYTHHGFQIIVHPREFELLRLHAPLLATPADIELGDLVVHRIPVLIAGVVLDPSGQPVEGANVYMHEWEGPVVPIASRDQLGRIIKGKVTGADGHFQFLGQSDAEQFVAVARRDKHESGLSQVVPKGTADLAITLFARGTIHGRFVSTGATFAKEWDVVVVPSGTTVPSYIVEAQQIEGAYARYSVVGDFNVRDLHPGFFDLHVFDHVTGEHALVLDGLNVKVGPCADPRLKTINPLKGMPVVNVKVRGPGGEVPLFVLVLSKNPPAPARYAQNGELLVLPEWTTLTMLDAGQGGILLPRPDAHLLFWTSEFATFEARNVNGDLDIQLEAPLKILASIPQSLPLEGPNGKINLLVSLALMGTDNNARTFQSLGSNLQKLDTKASTLKVGGVGTYRLTYYLEEDTGKPFHSRVKIAEESPLLTIHKAGEAITLDPPQDYILRYLGLK